MRFTQHLLFHFFWFFLFFICSSCGVKTDPRPPVGATLPSYLGEHFKNYKAYKNIEEVPKDDTENEVQKESQSNTETQQ